MPLLVAAVAPASGLIPLVAGTSLIFLALLGGLAARAGGAGDDHRRNPRHVLGSARHGTDRGRWCGYSEQLRKRRQPRTGAVMCAEPSFSICRVTSRMP